jgi:7-carboxy-7-deazaguanine synthase
MSVAEVVDRVKALGSPRVEVTGGEPLLQPGVYPLMGALLDAGLVVLLETSGAIDVRLVPPAVHKIVDVKCPGSGEVDRNDWRCLDSLTERDELKFVLASREDYDRAKARIAERKLDRGPAGLLFSTVHGELPPTTLAEWIIADRLPVRFQLQQHKVLWAPDARGV